MRVRNVLLAVVVATAGFIAVTVVVTELASPAIAFSVFVGLPAGVVCGVLVGELTHRWLGNTDSVARRRGAALAAFGVVFLVVLVASIVVGRLRNSHALPIAGGAGIVGGVGVYLRYRRSNRRVTSEDRP